MSWEDLDDDTPNKIPDLAPSRSNWDDEDASSGDDEPKYVVPESQPRSNKAKGPKIPKKKSGKSEKFEDEDIDPETKRLQDLQFQQHSDLKSAVDMFAGLESLVDFRNPKDEKDFEQLAANVSEKLSVHAKSYHYKGFLKNLFKNLASNPNVKVEDVKELVSALNVVTNEKIKGDRDATNKPKKGKLNTKKNVNVGGADLFDQVAAAKKSEDTFNDDDFM
eukprot:TRINITY_DN1010_c0_g2_i1.p1 TRINITY_DN1010_c0_g2~~TRINITY_DN1010_c0_g2_i1.p1  ORF type:complete len:220 (-),score=82.95 TRINITY_DN1010_c0_g2_i1:94-753(-)